MSDQCVYRTLRKEDDATVRQLVESAFPIFATGGFWDWKYLRNPNFDRSLIAIAENNGKIVGCNHWIKRKFKLTSSTTVDSMLGANIAVLPEYRMLGVGRALIHFLRSQNTETRPPLMYMFADPKLTKHFHSPVAGYVPSFNCTVYYMKILNWNKIRPSVDKFNQKVKSGQFKDTLTKANLTVAFKIRGAPTLCMHLGENGVDMDIPEDTADLVISSDMLTSNLLTEQGGNIRTFLKSLLTGKIEMRGSLRKIRMAYRYMWVFRQILGKNKT